MQTQGYNDALLVRSDTGQSSPFSALFSKVQKYRDVYSQQEVAAALNTGIFVPFLHGAVSPLQIYTDGIVSSWDYSGESVSHWKCTGM